VAAKASESFSKSIGALGDAAEMAATGRPGRGDLSDRRGGQWSARRSV